MLCKGLATEEQTAEIVRIVEMLGRDALNPEDFYEIGKPTCDFSTLSDFEFYYQIQNAILRDEAYRLWLSRSEHING
jgi:hypothetical protein